MLLLISLLLLYLWLLSLWLPYFYLYTTWLATHRNRCRSLPGVVVVVVVVPMMAVMDVPPVVERTWYLSEIELNWIALLWLSWEKELSKDGQLQKENRRETAGRMRIPSQVRPAQHHGRVWRQQDMTWPDRTGQDLTSRRVRYVLFFDAYHRPTEWKDVIYPRHLSTFFFIIMCCCCSLGCLELYLLLLLLFWVRRGRQ